jgi:hypothetical protein
VARRELMAAFVQSEWFDPQGCTAREYEAQSLLGPYLRLSFLPDVDVRAVRLGHGRTR